MSVAVAVYHTSSSGPCTGRTTFDTCVRAPDLNVQFHINGLSNVKWIFSDLLNHTDGKQSHTKLVCMSG